MFDFIRSHQRLMQFFLLVLIVPSFALIGVSGYNSYVSGDHDLVKIGKSAVTLEEFERARANQLRQMQESSQGGFDPAALDNPQVKRALLESLIDYRVVASTAVNERFNVSDVRLRDAIASMPQLQVEGQFSSERYNEALAAAGLTTRDFEQGQRFELAFNRVLEPVTQTARMPASIVREVERALTDERTLRSKLYPSREYTGSVSVSDDDVQAWYADHRDDFQIPEYATIQYLLLDEAAAMAALPEITEQELENYYEQNKTRFTQAARVKLSHIQINVPAGATQEQRDKALEQANEIATLLKAPDASFAEIARQHSQDAGTAKAGGELGWITQGSWPAGLDQAVFSLGKDEISDVIDGPGGYHIFLASDVQPTRTQDFASVRDQVKREVERQLGAERFADMATRLTSQIYDHPDSLEPAAQALGIKIGQASGVGRDRLLTSSEVGPDAAAASPHADILDDVRVRRAVFSTQVLNERHNSGVIEISPDTMLAVRIQELKPAHIPEVDAVADQIRDQLLRQKAYRKAVEAGQRDLAALQADSSALPDIADGFDEPVAVSRLDPHGIERPALDAALALAPDSLPAYAGVEGAQGFLLIHVEKAEQSEPDPALRASLSSELTQLLGQAEEQAVLKAMRAQAKVEVLPEADDIISGRRGDD